ncbi:MAG: T9SS type A sorting domain-containing protein, partial [Candidatus Delongbacteria bacterium]|nr:T9SS type A sorting domain-containing protein [Candidatus Delongbacteria bacterium]
AMSLPLFSVTVDGYAFLEGETDHSAIKVHFQRTVPDSNYSYSCTTDTLGYYTYAVEESGYYNITFAKFGYDNTTLTDAVLYSDQTLAEQNLLKVGLEGSINGIIPVGTYNVTSSITVEENDSLLIEPGVILNFQTGTQLIVGGYLKAEGTETKKIEFNAVTDNWEGISLDSSSVGLLKYCSINETCAKAIQATYSNLDITTSNISTFGDGIWLNDSYCNFQFVKIEGGFEDSQFGIHLIGSGAMNMNYSEIYSFDNAVVNHSWGYFGDVKIENTIIDDVLNGFACLPDLYLYNVTLSIENIGFEMMSRNVTICNSIIYCSNQPGAIGITDSSDLSVINSNVFGFYDNFCDCGPYLGVNVTTNANADSCDAYGNISMDPQFINTSNNNFRLQSDSPCIDAGTNTITDYEFPIADLDGNYRIWDGDGNSSVIVDMGAYEFGSPTEIENGELIIDNYSLSQNYPNPFNPETTISYSLINNAQVNLKVYDIAGREVCSLVDQKQNKGLHEVKFDGSRLTSGIYFYRLSIDEMVVSNKKMMLLK